MKITTKELGIITYGEVKVTEFKLLYDQSLVKMIHSTCACTTKLIKGDILKITYKPKLPKAVEIHVEKEIFIEYTNGIEEMFVLKAKIRRK